MVHAETLGTQVKQQRVCQVFFVLDQGDKGKVAHHPVFSCNLGVISGSCNVTVVPRPSP